MSPAVVADNGLSKMLRDSAEVGNWIKKKKREAAQSEKMGRGRIFVIVRLDSEPIDGYSLSRQPDPAHGGARE
jgi:hypothetical protein